MIEEIDSTYCSHLTCPYCGKEQDHPDLDGETSNIECQCVECDKVFLFDVEYDPVYSSRKADCLNGEEGEHLLPYSQNVYRQYLECENCGTKVLNKYFDEAKFNDALEKELILAKERGMDYDKNSMRFWVENMYHEQPKELKEKRK